MGGDVKISDTIVGNWVPCVVVCVGNCVDTGEIVFRESVGDAVAGIEMGAEVGVDVIPCIGLVVNDGAGGGVIGDLVG